MPNPLDWIAAKWADIRGLPTRLARVAARAHRVLSDTSRPRPERERASRIWIDALTDQREAERLISRHLRLQDDMAGLDAVPVVLIVGGLTAATVAATLVSLFGRASTYERELELLGAGTLTPDELERIRSGRPATGGVAGTLAELSGLARIALVGAAGWLAFELWG